MSIYHGLNLVRQARELSHEEWIELILMRQKLIAPFFNEIAHTKIGQAFFVRGPESERHPIEDDKVQILLYRYRSAELVPSDIRGIFSTEPPELHAGQWLLTSWGLINNEWYRIIVNFDVRDHHEIATRVELHKVSLVQVLKSRGFSPENVWKLLGDATIAWHVRAGTDDTIEEYVEIASAISRGLSNLIRAEHVMYDRSRR